MLGDLEPRFESILAYAINHGLLTRSELPFESFESIPGHFAPLDVSNVTVEPSSTPQERRLEVTPSEATSPSSSSAQLVFLSPASDRSPALLCPPSAVETSSSKHGISLLSLDEFVPPSPAPFEDSLNVPAPPHSTPLSNRPDSCKTIQFLASSESNPLHFRQTPQFCLTQRRRNNSLKSR